MEPSTTVNWGAGAAPACEDGPRARPKPTAATAKALALAVMKAGGSYLAVGPQVLVVVVAACRATK